jgi:hypothetical protein
MPATLAASSRRRRPDTPAAGSDQPGGSGASNTARGIYTGQTYGPRSLASSPTEPTCTPKASSPHRSMLARHARSPARHNLSLPDLLIHRISDEEGIIDARGVASSENRDGSNHWAVRELGGVAGPLDSVRSLFHYFTNTTERSPIVGAGAGCQPDCSQIAASCASDVAPYGDVLVIANLVIATAYSDLSVVAWAASDSHLFARI